MSPSPQFDVPSYEHVMIDIETMSLSKNNALILSVGMIEFDPAPLQQLCIGSRSLIRINIEQQLLLGREVSKSTQKWWKDQSREASAHWMDLDEHRANLAEACLRVKNFCSNATRVWANGTQFDLANLEGLNEQLGLDGQKELWHYQAPRDMRTFCRETPATRIMPIADALDIPGVAHEPVYDCIVQAWQVWAHWPH